ncbi:MAG: YqgE/AlgH family protein [Planctomycetota bacterium]|nr:YqgE/AlgH family protein [Planctomycetota bacterium]MDA1251007.1 YqgE/AlgH family protein [Planctomycetota bacterium]
MSESENLRGRFLIAANHLRDSNFYKTVVLLLEHNDDGAMGLVINRPMDVSVSSALSKHFDIPDCKHFLYCGGPVEPNALLILHNSQAYDQEHSPVVPGVYVGTSPDVFDKVVDAADDPDSTFSFQIFSGYSGWGAGQLESEIDRGDWFALPAESSFFFRPEPYEIWEDTLEAFHKSHRILPDQPDNPEWN